MGICIQPPHTVIGLDRFEQYEYRTQPVNHRSGAGDIDRTVYSLRKWAKLAAAGNPTLLLPLFVPEGRSSTKVDGMRLIRYLSDAGRELQANKHLFLSKQAGRRFLGYLDGQRSRYLDPARQDSKHASRPELIEKYGWDTKTGYHALRLAMQGIELMASGTITLPMPASNREFLLRVRNGEFSKEWVTSALDNTWIPDLKHAIERSALPDHPNCGAIDDLLIDMHWRFWTQVHPRDGGLHA
jgi:hypothetical protein